MELDVCGEEIVLGKKKNVSERNGSRERAHFKTMCFVCHNLKNYVRTEKRQSWRSVVSDGAKTFLNSFHSGVVATIFRWLRF